MKTILILIIALVLCSCVHVKYKDMEYLRFMASAEKIEVQLDDNTKATINGQKIDTATLNSILNLMGVVK